MSEAPLPQYGGQALIEGVMIRGARHVCVACREGEPGQQGPPSPDAPIFVRAETIETFAGGLARRLPFLRWPFLRGTLVLLESIELGSRGLRLSARVALGAGSEPPSTGTDSGAVSDTAEADVPSKGGPGVIGAICAVLVCLLLVFVAFRAGWIGLAGVRNACVAVGAATVLGGLFLAVKREEAGPASRQLSGVAVGATMALGLALGISVFFLFPSLVAGFFGRWLHAAWMLNLVEGGVRVLLFFGYLALVSRIPNIRRIFQYHGAEHQVIHVHESGLPLNAENAARFPTIHPRCGTAFIAVVLVVSVVVFAFAGWQSPWIRLPLRVALLPVVAGFSYELLKWNVKYPNPILRLIVAPGLWFQKITTQSPSVDQVEVALAAMAGVLSREKHELASEAVAGGTT